VPLSRQKLEESLFELFSSLEVIPPTDSDEAAKMWADAIGNYSKDITPSVSAAIIEPAIGVLALALFPALDNTLDPVTKLPLTPIPARPAIWDAAILTFVTVVAVVGMAPDFTGVPPAAPFFLSAFGPIPPPIPPLPPSTPEESANIVSGKIHSWFKLGTWTNNSSGATGLWL